MLRTVARFASRDQLRAPAFIAFGAVLAVAVWLQRSTITRSLGEFRSMPVWAVGIIVVFGVTERVVRAGIFRSLLGRPSYGCALTVHDVGTAASKGIPMGGPLATALRWSIARDAAIPTTTFSAALIASGAAAAFVTFTLPLLALGLDLTQRPVERTDLAALGVFAVMLIGSVLFWAVMLRSDRVHRWATVWCRRVFDRAARRIPAAEGVDPVPGLDEVRAGLRAIAARPWGLLARSAIAQICGAVVLLVALRGVGVGAELGTIEFLRVFFIVTLLGSFVPTPGGVGVIEAGLTGALVAGGVASTMALAAVLVYRLFTYVLPIVVGAVLYVLWRRRVKMRSQLPASAVPLPDRQGDLGYAPAAA